jgi:hypothetical protein
MTAMKIDPDRARGNGERKQTAMTANASAIGTASKSAISNSGKMTEIRASMPMT